MIDSIHVSPSNPTSSDNIDITVYGIYPSTGHTMDSTTYEIIGNEVYLNFYVTEPIIGQPTVIHHNEIFNVGSLANGDYHINIGGVSVYDNVSDPTQKYFSVGNVGLGSVYNTFDENILNPELILVTDLTGKETPIIPNTPLIYHYSDGSIKRIFICK